MRRNDGMKRRFGDGRLAWGAAALVGMAGAVSLAGEPISGSARRTIRLTAQETLADTIPPEEEGKKVTGKSQCPPVAEMRKDLKKISSLTVDITPKAPDKGNSVDRPENCAEEMLKAENLSPLFADMPRGFPETDFHWQAPLSVSYPLYFEDAALERYGQTVSPLLQPAISGVKFFGTIPILPYKMALDRPCECKYLLGYYRPGSCAPFVRERLPLRADAATAQALVVTGLVFLIP